MNFMGTKNILIAIAGLCVIVVVGGYYMGWFGGGDSQTETPVQQEEPAQTE